MKGKLNISLVIAIIIGIMSILPLISASTFNQSLGESFIDGNINAIGAYIWSAYNFTASSNYALDNVTIFVSDDGGLATATNVGVYMINSTNGVNITSFLGNSTNTINTFDANTNYTWIFSTESINLTYGQKYALVWNAGGSGNYIRVGETVNGGGGFSWEAGSTLSGLNFNTNSQVTSVNIKLFGHLLVPFAGGDGSLASPYQITNWTNLNAIRDYLAFNFTLMNNLSSSTSDYNGIGNNFIPIGTSSIPFTGTINGNNKTISSAIVNTATATGLFGSIKNAYILNLGLYNLSMNGVSQVGGLVGYMINGTISNSYSNGNVSGRSQVGGLVGYMINGTISNSYSNGLISATGSQVGGLVGYMINGTISNSYSNGNVSYGPFNFGGLVGLMINGTIINSYSNANVSGRSQVGGLVGYMINGTISNSYSNGLISATGSQVGGLVGVSLLSSCLNSYSNANVSGGSQVGGLVGYMLNGTISNSYSNGLVSGTGGGLVGISLLSSCLNSYWDNQTSGKYTSGCGNGTNTLNMLNISNYNSWNIAWSKVYINNGYPYLGWQNNNYSYRWLISDPIPLIAFNSLTTINGSSLGYTPNNLSIGVDVTDIHFTNTTLYIYNSTRDQIYNQTNYSSSFSYRFNPTYYGTYYFNATAYDVSGNSNSTETRQVTFYDFNFGLCNATNTVPYLNVTFVDESTGLPMSAQIKDLIATYYFAYPLATKTYTLTNLTNNPSYAFCFTPSFIPVNISLSFYYLNNSYTQKFYNTNTVYTNSTTNLTLSLLNIANAHLVSFQTLDSSSTPISNVYVQIFSETGGITSQVFSGYTDSTGVIGTYLNGLNSYTINYTKTGYIPYTQIVQPVLSSYSIYLTAVSSSTTGNGAGGSGSSSGLGSYIPQNNISWTFSHTPNQWFFNTSDSVTVFFNVTTNDNHYGGSRIEVWTNSTYMINWTAINKSVGNLTSLSLNQSFGSNRELIFKYFIYNSSSITDYHLVYTETFRVVNISEGPFTLSKGIKSWGNYTIAGGFEESFGTAWWVFFFICILVAVFCFSTGVELTNPFAISLGFTMIIGFISYAGLIYVPGMPTEFMRKYSILLVTVLFNIGQIASVWRER